MEKHCYNIAFIDHTTKMGGGQVYLLRQLSQLDKSRFNPMVVCPADGELPDHVRRVGVDMHIVPVHQSLIDLRKEDLVGHPFSFLVNPFRLASGIWRLVRWLKRHKIDLVHVNSMKAGFYGGLAARIARLPVVWDFKDIISDDFFPPFNRRLIVCIANLCADYVVANSSAIAEAFIAQGARKNKVRVIHNGIELTQFHPDNKPLDLHASLSLDPERPLVSIFSRLDRWKGHVYFLQAAAQTRQDHPDVHFLVVGATTFDNEGYTDELYALTRELGLTDCVHYLGFREDIADLMAISDVVVHASILPEPLGLTPMEAQAAGRPVIAAKAGGVLETVEDGVTGVLVPPKDAGAMAKALSDQLSAPDRGRQMGVAGRVRAEQLFDLKTNARRVQNVYLELMDEPD
jgi:glycosyltransferase involved in cell wall biosynthesis